VLTIPISSSQVLAFHAISLQILYTAVLMMIPVFLTIFYINFNKYGIANTTQSTTITTPIKYFKHERIIKEEQQTEIEHIINREYRPIDVKLLLSKIGIAYCGCGKVALVRIPYDSTHF
jgi:hypothetical protein